MAKTGVIELATGDLLRWGEGTTFTLDEGVEGNAPTPLPENPLRRYEKSATQMHRWDGNQYVLVPQPVQATEMIIVDPSGGKWILTVDESGVLSTNPQG